MKNTLIIILCALSTANLFSQSFDQLKLTANDIPKKYQLTENQNCISIQACTFYDDPEMYAGIIGKVTHKEVQNFDNENDSGSIMYFEFERDFKMQSFLEGLIWGDKKANKEHPEEFFIMKNIVIIWSFAQNSSLKKISKEKIMSVLK